MVIAIPILSVGTLNFALFWILQFLPHRHTGPKFTVRFFLLSLASNQHCKVGMGGGGAKI